MLFRERAREEEGPVPELEGELPLSGSEGLLPAELFQFLLFKVLA